MNEINVNPTWEDIEIATKTLIDIMIEYEKDRPEYIVGVSRGGLIPAVIASQLLDIPLVPISYSSKIGVGDQRNHDNALPNITGEILSGTGMGVTRPSLLIIDDIADSGHTIIELFDHYSKQGHNVFTMSIYYKESSVFLPDFAYYSIPEDAPFINFPWERCADK